MISEFVEYVKQVWKNKPNVSSPLNADRLNHMESGIENNSKKIKETVTEVNELTENSKKFNYYFTDARYKYTLVLNSATSSHIWIFYSVAAADGMSSDAYGIYLLRVNNSFDKVSIKLLAGNGVNLVLDSISAADKKIVLNSNSNYVHIYAFGNTLKEIKYS